jgi:hypothetical protein
VCSENGLPLARTMNVEYDERAEIKQSETEPTRVHTYNSWKKACYLKALLYHSEIVADVLSISRSTHY